MNAKPNPAIAYFLSPLLVMLASMPALAAPIEPAELIAPKISLVGGNVELRIEPSVFGRRYQLQHSDTLTPDSWINLETEWLGDGGPLVIVIPRESGESRRFYRLVLVHDLPVPEGFVLIPAGSFTMGRTSGDTDADAPPVNVHVGDFYMARHEVTWQLWNEVRSWGSSRGYTDIAAGGGVGPNYPVHWVNWWDVVKWCNARSEKDGRTPVYTVGGQVMRTGTAEPVANWNANGYRLPTEAEWEKAARGGVAGLRFPWGDHITHSHANYRSLILYEYDTSPTRGFHPSFSPADAPYPYTAPVGSFSANGYGLYDMIGNASEWCWDWYSATTYQDYEAGISDPKGPASGTQRVFRGGWWDASANYCRSGSRGGYPPGIAIEGGLRTALGK